MAFALHHNLAATSVLVADLPLCQVRLQQDARFAWLVLVPRREGAAELGALSKDECRLLMDEIGLASAAVRAVAQAAGRPVDRINVAALGNVTPQLHVHVLGRRRDDPFWPDPVWGRGGAEVYSAEGLERTLGLVRTALSAGS